MKPQVLEKQHLAASPETGSCSLKLKSVFFSKNQEKFSFFNYYFEKPGKV